MSLQWKSCNADPVRSRRKLLPGPPSVNRESQAQELALGDGVIVHMHALPEAGGQLLFLIRFGASSVSGLHRNAQ